MKKSKLILLALVGLFFFYSCKDELPEEVKPSTEANKRITMLKSLTGKTTEQGAITLENWGYVYIDTDYDENFIFKYYYSHITNIDYFIAIYNDTIVLSCSSQRSNRKIALNNFETLSQACIDYMSGKDFKYQSFSWYEEGYYSEFTTNEEFVSDFITNKQTIMSSYQVWDTEKDYLHVNFYIFEGEYTTDIRYADNEYYPELTKNIKTTLKELKSRRK